MKSEIRTGKIIWFSLQKGYGFISLNDSQDGKDVFLHCKGLMNIEDRFKLQPGVELQFLIEQTEDKRIRAIDVELIEGIK